MAVLFKANYPIPISGPCNDYLKCHTVSNNFPPRRGCKRKAGRSAVRRARGTPADLREGMLGAMALVREGLDETARSLSDAASDGRGGMTGAFGGVLR